MVPKCSPSPRWAWVLQDVLGIAFCLYMLKTIRLPTFKVRAASERGRHRPGWRSEAWARHGFRCWGVMIGAVLVGPSVLGTGPAVPAVDAGRGGRSGLTFTGLHDAAVGALLLRCLLRLHHPLPDQGRSPLPSRLPTLFPALADKPVSCRVATASWWRWPPGPRTHPPRRRYATPSCMWVTG